MKPLRADSNRRRPASAACLLLHLLVVGWAPLADAALEAASAADPVHIEAERDAACAPGHNHLFCQLCRAIELQITAPRRSRTETVLVLLTHRTVPGALQAVASTHIHSPLGPRAPPSS